MPLAGMSQDARVEVRRLYRKGLGAVRITGELARQQQAGELPDAPSQSSIGRELAKLRSMSETELRDYDEAIWPGSFGGPDLPWEAGAAIIELTHHLRRPPLLPMARWYWRVRLALPVAPTITWWAWSFLLAATQSNKSLQEKVSSALVAGLDPMQMNFDLPEIGNEEGALRQVALFKGPLTQPERLEIEAALERATMEVEDAQSQ